MASEFEEFISATETIAKSRMAGLKAGRRMGRLQDVGVFLPPNSPAHLVNRLCVEILSEEDWEKMALKVLENMPAPSLPMGKAPQESTIIKSINLSRT